MEGRPRASMPRRGGTHRRGAREGGAWRHSASGQPTAKSSPAMTRPAGQRPPMVATRPGCFWRNRSRRCRPGHGPPTFPHAGRMPPRRRFHRLPPPPLPIDGPPMTGGRASGCRSLHGCAPGRRPRHCRRTARRMPGGALPWRSLLALAPSAGRLRVALEGLEGMGKGRRRTSPAHGPQDGPGREGGVFVHPAGHPRLSVDSGGIVEDSRSNREGGRFCIRPPWEIGFPPHSPVFPAHQHPRNIFPTIGKLFSNHWKSAEIFSNRWKTVGGRS